MTAQEGIGIDIGGTFIKYGIVNTEGKVYWEAKKPTKAKTSRNEVVQNIVDAAKEASSKARELGLSIKSIGIGTPGLVTNDGTILSGADNIIDWDDLPLRQLLQKQLSLPIFVKNDADMMAIGEIYTIKTKPTTAILFTFGTGIGGAIIVNGQLFSGHFGLGGELGVFPMLIHGKVQNWEEVASTTAMVNWYKNRCPHQDLEINGKYIVLKYFENEELAIETIDHFTHLVGMGIAGYINVFNPELVIIGGGISEAGDFFIEKIKSHISKYALKPCLQDVKINLAKLGNRAGFIGAGIYGLLNRQQ